jgi:hypothetical protein
VNRMRKAMNKARLARAARQAGTPLYTWW